MQIAATALCVLREQPDLCVLREQPDPLTR